MPGIVNVADPKRPDAVKVYNQNYLQPGLQSAEKGWRALVRNQSSISQRAEGLANIAEGAFQAATPFVLAGGASAPGALVKGAVVASALSNAGQKAIEAAGGNPDWAHLAGVLAGMAGGPKGAKPWEKLNMTPKDYVHMIINSRDEVYHATNWSSLKPVLESKELQPFHNSGVSVSRVPRIASTFSGVNPKPVSFAINRREFQGKPVVEKPLLVPKWAKTTNTDFDISVKMANLRDEQALLRSAEYANRLESLRRFDPEGADALAAKREPRKKEIAKELAELENQNPSQMNQQFEFELRTKNKPVRKDAFRGILINHEALQNQAIQEGRPFAELLDEVRNTARQHGLPVREYQSGKDQFAHRARSPFTHTDPKTAVPQNKRLEDVERRLGELKRVAAAKQQPSEYERGAFESITGHPVIDETKATPEQWQTFQAFVDRHREWQRQFDAAEGRPSEQDHNKEMRRLTQMRDSLLQPKRKR